MSTKKYKILIETAYVDAGAGKAASDLGKVEAAAARAAKANEAAAARAAKANEAAAAKAAKAADQAAKASEAAAARAAKANEAAAAKAAKAADQAARAAEQAAARAARAEEARAAKAVRAAEQAARAEKRLLTDTEVAEKARAKVIEETNRTRVDTATEAMKAEGAAADMAGRFAEGLVALVGPLAGLAGAQAIVGGVAKAFSDAQAAAEMMGRQVLDTLGDLREIAAIKGKYAPDDEDLRKFADLRKESGLSQSEAMSFSGQLQNALGTVSESRFGTEEREKLEIGGGKLAARMGGGEEGARARASMLGLLPGFLPDRDAAGRPRKITAGEVIGTEDLGEEILSRGFASNTMMAQQAQKVLTALGSPEMKGKIRNPLEAYGLTAVASKFEPEAFGSAAMEFTREISGLTRNTHAKGFDATQAEFLKRAGVTEEMNPRQRAAKVFAQIDKETNKGKDRDIEQYLKEQGFTSEIGPRRIAQFYEQHRTGLFEDVMGMADRKIDPAAPDRKFAEFAKSKAGRDVLNQAAIDSAKTERGLRRAPLILERDAAKAELIGEGALDDPLSRTRERIGLGLANKVMGTDTEFLDFAAEKRAMEKRGLSTGGGLAGTLSYGSPVSALIMPILGEMMQAMSGSNAARLNEDIQRQQLEELKRIGGSLAGGGGPAPAATAKREGRP